MSFQYHKLDPNQRQIRLLSIHPPIIGRGPIHCSLHTVSLDDSPEFEAISYVWGTEDSTEHIFLDGNAFYVKPNVAKALYQLRRTFRRRVVWLDAICINQCDVGEMNTQLPLMATIYTSAARVVAMLGDATPEIELAVAWAERYREKRLTKGALHWWWLDIARVFSDKAKVNRVYMNCGTLRGMIQIMTMPYWFRMWTYQEYLLPKRQPLVVCGNLKFNISTVLEGHDAYLKIWAASHGFGRIGNLPSEDVASLKRLWDTTCDEFHEVCNHDEVCFLRGNQMFDYWYVPGNHFERTSHRKCQNPKDRIYALYGVMPDLQEAFPPDYNKKFEQIALETTIWMIGQEESMFLMLAPCAAPDTWSTRLPSWVLDYRPGSAHFITSYRNLRLLNSMGLPEHFQKAKPPNNGLEHMITKVSDNKSILHLPARRFAKCQALLQFSTDTRMIASQLIKVFEMIEERWKNIDCIKSLQQHLLDTWSSYHLGLENILDVKIRDMLSKIAELDLPVTEGEMWEREGVPTAIFEHLQILGGHWLFLAHNSHLSLFGISRETVEDDDIFTIPYLLNRPLILRISDTVVNKGEKTYYKVVGQAIAGKVYHRSLREAFTQQSIEEFLVI
ncbi:uncharacterized protein BO88DRAFT_454620 [Aspergillus vadensis CBS 113365]|uniref:Heterokaryon incompatibility domain-containing protein n=1 Tax=Aspergillus vadensis (strain CBS 113365 / IMI 142717 / IBT 24658) TaxID=1448311 RepID=A0A319CJ70_ASPVC|nr:hypothetical protein BO88DRAFT_454620 [Aspergillus vadensis CBS 113365]PYH68332.1 hypothetical protein BO88DRAFT_454620 [Aspergillus vadensis CBS 113365]